MGRHFNDCSSQVIDSCIKVHSLLGPGLIESAYEICLAYELRQRGAHVIRQLPVAIRYGGVQIDAGFRIDLLVNRAFVVELKAVSKLLPVHEAQLLSYLKLGGFRVGLLVNFHVLRLKDGIRRFVNGFDD